MELNKEVNLIREKRRRILFVVEAMGGGVFSYIVDLANKLIESIDVYIAYGIRKETPTNYTEYFDKRIKLIEIENFTREMSLNKDIKAFFELKNVEKQIKPHIIHLHSSKAGALGRIAFNGKKNKLFYTPHGYSFLISNTSILKKSFYYIVERILSMRNCKTISCSKGEHIETIKFNNNANYVNNGININALKTIIKNCNSKKMDNKPTIFTIGRICEQKNPELFNKIAERLPNFDFVWIGDGDQKDKLTSKNITITGWMDRYNVIKKSVSSDIFILTSLWEGLPISLLEAMYMKKVCIVNNVIGNKDVIINEENGYICNNVDEFVNCINMVIEKDHNDMTDKSYNDILMNYNTDTMLKKYKEIYGE